MATTEIKKSVGRLGANNPDDVIIVQRLLKDKGFDTGTADGQCCNRTLRAILTFQTGFLKEPDGRIDPGGKSWKHLIAASAPIKPVTAPKPVDQTLSRTIARPDKATINVGLVAVSNTYMKDKLGSPRADFSQDCQPTS